MDPNSLDQSNSGEQQIAWRAVPQDVLVRAQGQDVGSLFDLLGSDEEDIFHGIVIRLHPGKRVFVPADDVTLLTASHVDVDLGPDELARLPEHTEERQFELGYVGLRHRLGWKQEKDR
jgi:hypothetical protein